MIDIKFAELAILVVAGTFLLLGFLLFLHSSRNKSHYRKRRRQIVTCPVCGEVFEDRSTEKLPACSGCGRKTLRGNDRSLG